ncbi:hypothetical protein H6G27_18715 [Nostoc linckia FACHB-104]|nr:hypothetical protein [Nostoc linckia FACHB-104]
MKITQEVSDDETLAKSEFENYIDQLTEIAPEIEIDSVPDELGELYRVWSGYHLLGTFYQNLEGKWVAQPSNSDDQLCCGTPLQAQLLIIAANGLLVADVA